jgi:hypothetical protein
MLERLVLPVRSGWFSNESNVSQKNMKFTGVRFTELASLLPAFRMF